MKNNLRSIFCLMLASGGSLMLAQTTESATGSVASPAKRQEILQQARQLFAVREAPALAADPFHSAAFAEVVAGAGHVPGVVAPVSGVATGPRNDHDILEAIAAHLKPSGNFILGGQSTLIFGQKRVKAGGSLTITFEGTEYTLEITAIERTNFTLRLNREEFTRPIK